jgi:UDP-N-acetylglucosamine 1-carboxyvinyltransferase
MTLGPETSYRVRGGTPLHGTVFVQGAKNAALKMIAASLLTGNGRTVLRNVPPIEDVRRAVELAQAVGARVEFHEPERTLVVDASRLTSPVLPAEIARRFRGTVLFVPALLHRFGEAVIEGVGGCNLGNRNLDFHYRGFARLGATVDEGDSVIRITAPAGLRGAHLYLDTPSHTGTENLIMAASLAPGRTVIDNTAQEPEVLDVISFLTKMGGSWSRWASSSRPRVPCSRSGASGRCGRSTWSHRRTRGTPPTSSRPSWRWRRGPTAPAISGRRSSTADTPWCPS